ncbi:hypothetical protein [Microseira wollei]|uniref:Uncharacterized protein n=1 Tax=Microseira wollei NIES-4236 TaxID=2530354 RepID=A0AAV3X7A9_9CYAN|nr:hypothetical protein [Microseira wollei]GET36506.1 hypothetical protein MiSe_12570 [Microseira wollei NIES-4236]
MKSKNLLIAGVLAAILVANPTVAQNQEIDNELYQLCTQFPLNSRCAGFNKTCGIPHPPMGWGWIAGEKLGVRCP